jgi:hypothetical protein
VSAPSYRSVLQELAAGDDIAFAEYVSGLRYPAHLRSLLRFQNEHRPGASGALLPRGHAKTTEIIHLVARLIGERRGRVKVIIATEADAAAVRRSLAVRRIVESPAFAQVFPWANAGVAGKTWSEATWTVRGAEAYVDKDATLRAGSLLSLKPGPRADMLVCDDLVGPDESTNRTQRAKALDRYLAVIEPMLTPDAWVLVVGTRWHEDDLYAALMARGVPFFNRRAIGPDGAALWPEYWPLARLIEKREGMGSALFDLQYQNDPTGLGGNIFKRDWFRDVDTLPPGSRRAGMDLASSTSERSDYNAVVEWWEDADYNLYAIGAYQARLEAGHRKWLTGVNDDGTIPPTDEGGLLSGPRLLWPVKLLPPGPATRGCSPDAPRPLSALKIEASTFQSTFVAEVLNKTRLPVGPVHPDRDKVTRSRTLAARMEAGKVFFLRGAPGIEMLKGQLTAFPNGEHDDLVDAAVYGADLGGPDFYFTSGQR